MSFIVLDASVWVSRLVPQDIYHTRVKAWMESKAARGVIFLSPALLLAEVAGAISRRLGEPELAQRVVENLQALPGLRLVEMDRSLTQEAARLAASIGLRGADAFYVALAARLALPLVTLDADQMQRSGTVVAIQSLEESE